MVDKTQRAHAANNVLNNETVMDSLTEVQNCIMKELLSAKTPEEREQKYFEYSAIERLEKKLAVWASIVRHNKERK